jgi:protein CpxP
MMKGLAMANRTPHMIALLLTATLLSNPTWAQDVAPTAPARTARPERGGAAQVERPIAGLQRRLKITSQEQPPWDAFAAVMRQNAAHIETLQRDRADKVATMSAPDDMRSYAGVARAHADDLQQLAAAFDTLYAAMTPEQKAEADRTFHQFQGRGRVRPQP